jgi:hypothetical protein
MVDVVKYIHRIMHTSKPCVVNWMNMLGRIICINLKVMLNRYIRKMILSEGQSNMHIE